MQARFFRTVGCPACGRPCEEAGQCPWCSAAVSVSRGTVARLLALVCALALPFLPFPAGPGAARVAAVASAFVLAAPIRHRSGLLAMAVAAVAVCALVHAFPGVTLALAIVVRRHLRWIAPALALAAIASGAARLPPLPADGGVERWAQVLKTPAVLALCAFAWVGAAGAPALPAACVAAALCSAAILAGARALSCTVAAGLAALIGVAFVAPMSGGVIRFAPCGVFAAAIAAFGMIHTLAAMNRSESEPSSQP